MLSGFDSLRSSIIEKLKEFCSEAHHPLILPLFEAALYSLSSGKRLRPLLTIKTAEIYHVAEDVALTPACALEMIHAYSLIHDDLPCMDDDDMRRGAPTLHKVYDEGHAVLTGDFLLTYAFELLATAPGLNAETRLALTRTLAERAGANGMLGGQVIDLSIEELDFDLETIELMHRKKTGALFACALEFGGIIGRAPARDLALLKQIGEEFGIAYQIFDDLEDAGEDNTSCLQILTPSQAQALAQEKLTLVSSLLSSLSVPSLPLSSLLDSLSPKVH
ncbi:MAG: polyprenyl synthetase family protein [Chlamydiales bacterium]|nr:polyprenyl synthetase family protein [Chlamydiales bacterium]